MKKWTSLFCCLAVFLLAAPAQAAERYDFIGANSDEFFQAGGVYDSRFGANAIVPELNQTYGLEAGKPTNAPGHFADSGTDVSNANGSFGLAVDGGTVLYPEVTSTQSASGCARTSAEDARQADGSIGTLRIPAIGLTVTAYDGDVTAAMLKGVGFIDSTSAWDGNIGLSGHNRGVTYHFGNLHKLNVGDEMTYTTALGTRAYAVTAVQQIAADDWSCLQYTTDNRITLITCVAGQPSLRLCVQATEVPNR